MSVYLITGGAGFIGSHFTDYVIHAGHKAIVLDSLSYAGDVANLKGALTKGAVFVKGDINNIILVSKLLRRYKVDAIIHFAAESHVDNSINNSVPFMRTNVLGTHALLQVSLAYYNSLKGQKKNNFRFINVSTDEVYGTLGSTGKFTEKTSYDPRSPYSASKAAADHLVMAWHHTYKLPVIITHCSNNYGSRQYPEKLIPKTINAILDNKPILIYGKGDNIRDWIHVSNHCHGIYKALTKGKAGEHYIFGGNNELTNLELVTKICTIADKFLKRSKKSSHLIKFVTDRKGHDFRYAVDFSKAEKELDFIPFIKQSLDIELAFLVAEYLKKRA